MPSPDKMPQKAKRMVEYLQEVIYTGKLRKGSKIPTLRKLAEQFDLSLGTAKRGIDYLCNKKLLEANRGSGIFVANKKRINSKDMAPKIIAIMPWMDNHSGIINTIYSGMLEKAYEQKTPLMLSHVGLKEFKTLDLNEIANGCEAVVMLGEYDTVASNNIHITKPLVVSCMHNNFDGCASLFEMDPFQSAELAVQYFRKHKIEHVKCYSMNNPIGVMRIKQFRLQWKEAGGTVDYHEFSNPQQAENAVFEPNGCFLFSSGWIMDMFCKKSRREFSVKLAESATVLGLDGRCCVDPNYDFAPTIYTDWKKIGYDIYQECITRISNPGIPQRRYYYPVELIESQKL